MGRYHSLYGVKVSHLDLCTGTYSYSKVEGIPVEESQGPETVVVQTVVLRRSTMTNGARSLPIYRQPEPD